MKICLFITILTALAIRSSTSQQSKKQPAVLLCDFSRNESSGLWTPNKPCNGGDHFNFRFWASFRNRNMLKPSSLRYIAQTLGENTICDVKYMKYNNESRRLEYFNSVDSFYWFEGKQFNQTFSPEVTIIRDNGNSDRRKIVFSCNLPRSDVYMSINRDDTAFKPAQSYPLVAGRVTVSAFHVELKFMQMDKLNLNLKKNYDEYTLLDNFIDLTAHQLMGNNIANHKSSERFIVYYNSKCRNCALMPQSNEFNPLSKNSVNCELKENSCEYEGACLENREIYTPINYGKEEEKPYINTFVCKSDFSQWSLYMPCAVNNGNCVFNQTCTFNARELKVTCE